MQVKNKEYSINLINNNDIFICALGNESRSFYMLNTVKDKIALENIIVFCFDDIAQHNKEVYDYIDAHNVEYVKAHYNNWESAIATILDKYKNKPSGTNIHIDYSSMPRGWYSRIPSRLAPKLHENDQLFFWYVEATSYTSIPNAGIKSFDWFFGKPRIRPGNKRVHVLALGFDSIRTQAAISMLDPDAYITCMAYDLQSALIGETVQKNNKDIISHAIMSTSLPIDNFEFMLSKVCEIVRDLLDEYDVVLIPDGPKPLIFAMSLVPQLIKKEGISCLHIVRNTEYESLSIANNVLPNDKIIGFSIR